MKFLPERGNRNSFLTLWMATLSVAAWAARGIATSDWADFEWLMGALGVISGSSAFRARGAYNMLSKPKFVEKES